MITSLTAKKVKGRKYSPLYQKIQKDDYIVFKSPETNVLLLLKVTYIPFIDMLHYLCINIIRIVEKIYNKWSTHQ